MAVNVFEKKQGAAKDRAKRRRNNPRTVIPDKKEDVVPEERYPGVVKNANKDLTYGIQFDDGTFEDSIPGEWITSLGKPEKIPYQVGELVVRLAQPDVPGRVLKKYGSVEKDNLSYDIEYQNQDKSKEYKVADNLIKPLKPRPLLLNIGDRVESRSSQKESGGGDAKISIAGAKSTANPMTRQDGRAADSDDEDELVATGGGSSPAKPPSSPTKYKAAPKEDMDAEPLLGEDEDKQAQEKAEDDQESKDMISSFKSMTGLWPEVDPPDCQWMKLQQVDKNTGEATPKGEICYSIQIWPKDKALVMKAGAARAEPNSNPYLPPPVGRLKWSWNPFVLGSELCGPMLCAKLFCCLLCIAFVLLMVFCQPFLTLMINILFFFGR